MDRKTWFMIYHFIIMYMMFQFMDKSFIVTVRLSKETGYNYNITLRIVYICTVQSKNRYNSGIVLLKVRILT